MKILSDKDYADLIANQSKAGETKRLQEKIKDLEKEIKLINQDKEREVKRIKSDIDLEIREKTNKLTDENNKLKIEKENALKEVSILTKAFENLGFDVKDMKDILNKLVDGIVSKNSIKLVK